MQTRSQHLSKGMAVSEFVLTVPVFFLLILISLEFTMMQVDRHLLFNALVSSSRVAMFQGLSVPGSFKTTGGTLINPLTLQGEVECSDKTVEKVRQQIALKMSATATPLHEFLSGLGLGDLSDMIKLPTGTEGLLGGPLKRMISGYIPALLSTTVQECKATPAGLQLKIKYQRAPRIPFAGTAVWALYCLAQMNSLSQDVMEFSLDDNFFGIKIKSPGLGEASKHLEETLFTIRKSGLGATELTAAVNNNPFLKDLTGDRLNIVTDKLKSFGTSTIETKLNDGIKSIAKIEEQIQTHAHLVAKILYLVPPTLRVVPMTRSVTLSWGTGATQRLSATSTESTLGKWTELGTNYLVAPYKADNSSSDDQKIWEQWHKRLAQSDHEDLPGEKK